MNINADKLRTSLITRTANSAIVLPLVILLLISSGKPSYSVTEKLVFSLVLCSVFGLAHGASDYFVYRRETKLGNKSLPIFPVYFLTVTGGICLWQQSASIMLSLFLLVSIYHFMEEEEQSLLQLHLDSRCYSLGKALLVIGAPCFVETRNVTDAFAALSCQNFASLITGYLALLSVLGLVFYLVGLIDLLAQSKSSKASVFSMFVEDLSILVLLSIYGAFIAFTYYFCFVHALRETLRIVLSPAFALERLPWHSFIIRTAPLTLLTLPIAILGAAAAPQQTVSDLLVRLIFITLGVLTFAHIMAKHLWRMKTAFGFQES